MRTIFTSALVALAITASAARGADIQSALGSSMPKSQLTPPDQCRSKA